MKKKIERGSKRQEPEERSKEEEKKEQDYTDNRA